MPNFRLRWICGDRDSSFARQVTAGATDGSGGNGEVDGNTRPGRQRHVAILANRRSELCEPIAGGNKLGAREL
jgi:hypothetical protein